MVFSSSSQVDGCERDWKRNTHKAQTNSLVFFHKLPSNYAHCRFRKLVCVVCTEFIAESCEGSATKCWLDHVRKLFRSTVSELLLALTELLISLSLPTSTSEFCLLPTFFTELQSCSASLYTDTNINFHKRKKNIKNNNKHGRQDIIISSISISISKIVC